MITVAQSRSGASYAETGTIRIHSSYDPVKEARKFIAANITSPPSVVLLLGPGLNYLENVISDKYPETLVLSIHYDKFFFSKTGNRKDTGWFPESDESLYHFLYKRIDDYEFDSLLVLEWPPSAAAFPEIARYVNREIGQFAREMNGSIFATAKFGKKWFTNAFQNFVLPEYFHKIIPGNKPVVIAASGPTLPLSYSIMKEYRQLYTLWALPSSLPALFSSDIVPDLIVSTDAGFYSGYHFYLCKNVPHVPIAMPLTALPAANFLSNPIVPLNQSTVIENLLLQNLSVPTVSIPPHGTVAGSAFELAEVFQADPIVFSGFDCCYIDLQEHVKPHSYDILLSVNSTRLQPEYSAIYHRARSFTSKYDITTGIRTSPALETYAGWFNSRSRSEGVYPYRLHPSPINLAGFLPLKDSGFKEVILQAARRKPLSEISLQRAEQPDRHRRKQYALSLLSRLVEATELLENTIERSGSAAGFLASRELFTILSFSFVPEIREIVKLVRTTGKESRKAVHTAAVLLDTGKAFFNTVMDKIRKL